MIRTLSGMTEPKEKPQRGSCYVPAAGYRVIETRRPGLFALVLRVAEYVEKYREKHFVGLTERVVWIGSETQVERRCQELQRLPEDPDAGSIR